MKTKTKRTTKSTPTTKAPFYGLEPSSTPEEYVLAQEKFLAKIGDTRPRVRVVRLLDQHDDGYPYGWQNSWSDSDMKVGQILRVAKDIHQTGPHSGIQLENGFGYPFFCLEILEEPVQRPRFSACEFTYADRSRNEPRRYGVYDHDTGQIAPFSYTATDRVRDYAARMSAGTMLRGFFAWTDDTDRTNYEITRHNV